MALLKPDGILDADLERQCSVPPGPVRTYYLTPEELERYRQLKPPPGEYAPGYLKILARSKPTKQEVERTRDEVTASQRVAPGAEKLTWPPTADELRSLIKQGKTTRELAEIFSTHPANIDRLKDNYGIRTRDLLAALINQGVPSVPPSVPSVPQVVPPGPDPGEIMANLEREVAKENQRAAQTQVEVLIEGLVAGLPIVHKSVCYELVLVTPDGEAHRLFPWLSEQLESHMGKRITILVRPVA